ncbi:translation initiation factor IF-3 [Metamycoplasma hominis]|uniref:translation initiation factor IF-3 n=1 Tax=Metamycoplasma hominis TaxID=2098 RepID=UPI0003616783|nr:translation initiation factor IF-3 [Metamycoplasma hominis]AIU33882.1 translation initiation factor IF-3 [Metamycoplasma hominis ATCC 27545]KGF61651.1 translation initiation factor IF-3 [Metamycoplasma hominis]MCZ2781343.1 translation initiation factor IF-3 [Metamycoplasma hominis]OKL24006.1 translation initiation factor IF-3 [Metamycoplasma hominis]
MLGCYNKEFVVFGKWINTTFLFIKEGGVIINNQKIGDDLNNNQTNRKPKSEHVINNAIPYKKVFVLGPTGEKIGVLTKEEALEKASEYNMDLVLIAIENNKPIVRILDYGKFKYDKKKRQKEVKEKQAVTVNREIRLTPLIGDHDLKTKANKTREFILDGNRVKVSVKFRGRERARIELGEEILKKFFALIEDVAKISKEATLVNDRFLDMYVEKDKRKVDTLTNKKDN